MTKHTAGSNAIVKPETAGTMLGVKGRYFPVVAASDGRIRNQQFKAMRAYTENGRAYTITVEVRFDDECNNGHESFAITADIREGKREYMGGCCLEEIAKHFPELAPLIKWHLTSTDGPMHYIANVLYLAGDADCNGLKKGERRQIVNGKTKLPAWQLVAIDANGSEAALHDIERYIDAAKQPPCPYRLEYRPWCSVGEGKARELDAARSVAVWPDAADATLCLPRGELKALLEARLPALIAEFKADMLRAGFLWPVAR